MYRLPDTELAHAELAKLLALQTHVNAGADFAQQVLRAKAKFASKPSTLFKKVRARLSDMAGQLVRCAYCEDSCADEVEHIYPKDFYPGRVFDWNNYLFACGPCNGGKSNKFSVLLAGNVVVSLPDHRAANGMVPPPAGATSLIDPRVEDPLQFLWLDMMQTFRFTVLDEDDAVARVRAKSTIDDLGLNRDVLVEARKNAFQGYGDRLAQYVARQIAGDTPPELAPRIQSLKTTPHRTVWLEMKRQRVAFPMLNSAFVAAPEAMAW